MKIIKKHNMNNFIQTIKKYVRLANYVTVSQIYLRDNFLLERGLNFDDIKSRLLGHWGTCPGINFVYANLNYLIKKYSQEMLFVLGPGHGFPALQANLFIEGTLKKFYPEATVDESGLGYISKNFSWPYEFPSHSNPGTPGVILEGGELGYSLSTAYGAILDNPNLIATCLIGDGEAETGPLSASWHLNKFIDPKENGAVLPILHLNGYKISGPTVFGRMSNKELKSLFYGYGYEPIIIGGFGIYVKMQRALEKSLKTIKSIQSKARQGKKIVSPRWPMIVLRTPKGWTGIKELDDKKIEGNCLSHQVVAKDAKTNIEHLEALEKWMRSYKINEFYNKEDGIDEDILSIIPESRLRMGEIKYAFAGKMRKDLILPNPDKFAEEAIMPGTIGSSSMRRLGLYLKEVFELNAKNRNFRLMSPDETYSNKLDEIFKVTQRAFVWPKEKWDDDLDSNGRVMEMLSEHSLQGLAQGYVLTGRHMVFASYEAFVEIVASMADQYAKFLKVARATEWRGDMSSFNYILTSSGWRQEHNGFSHQNPGFISNMLRKEGDFIKAYFPSDGTSALVVLDHCLKSKNCINIIVAGKTLEPRWLTPELAKQELERGMMIWNFASDKNPDIIFSSIGDYMTKECLAAIDYLKKEFPEVKTRLVNIVELSSLGFGKSGHTQEDFDFYFTKNKPVIFNFHGYPETIKQLLFGKGKNERFFVHGYIENGSTTTPFDMQVRNKTDRFSLVIEAFGILAEEGKINKDKAIKLIKRYEDKLRYHDGYIRKYGVDMEEVEDWQWKRNS